MHIIKYKSQQLIFLLVILLFHACKKEIGDQNDDEPLIQNIDPFVPEFDAWISTMPNIEKNLEDLTLDNGIDVFDYLMQHDPSFINNLGSGKYALNTHKTNFNEEQQYNLFIARMVAVGNNLVSTSSHIKPQGENTNEPAQNKLVYSFGSKSHFNRAFPTTGDCKTVHKIYGLDCSG